MTDEPLGSHVLELQVADVIDETADARSLVFTVPEGEAARRFRPSGCGMRPVSS